MRDVQLVQLNGNEAQISWKPPTSLQNTKLTYEVLYNTDGSTRYQIRRTGETFYKIALAPGMTTIKAAVAYYDPTNQARSAFYPQPFAKLLLPPDSDMFHNIPSLLTL